MGVGVVSLANLLTSKLESPKQPGDAPMAVMGLVPVASAGQLEAESKAAAQKEADAKQNSTLIQGLAGHCRSRWDLMQEGRSTYEERLAKNLRQRKGEYDSDMLQAIKEIGGSEIFMGITSVKCRAASAWLRDTLTGNGTDKPWGLQGTPIPDLPPEVVQRIHGELTAQIQQYVMSMGELPPDDQVRALAEQMRDQAAAQLRDESKKRVERMELKMEDQLVEGGFRDTFSQFIDDLCTFPLAILKGPVPRKHKTLQWNGDLLEPVDKVQDDWDRIDPFKFYFAPWASSVNSGPIIERHSLTRADLFGMIGVEGYSEVDIRAVLTDFDGGGLRSWLDASADSVQASAEGRTTGTTRNTDLIDAIQLWDEVQGSKLIEWGMDEVSVPDPESSYPCEVWLIGSRVIKAVLNYDPLGRKPYFVTSYERIPGQMAGNSVPDLVRDPQDMCNASARALANNMGIACLTADTVVYRNGTGNDPTRREVTIGELWESKQQHNSGLRRNLLRTLDETTGEFISNRVQDIHFNGVQSVFRVTTESGYTIKATHTHRFMSADGAWRRLEAFAPGDLIAVNGATTPLAERRAAIRESHPSVDVASLPATAVMTPEQAQVDHEVHYARMVCDDLTLRLRAVCKKWHARHDNKGKDPFLHKYLDYDRIVSIEALPAEPVYDLEMVAPHHNFIANGFVSHNSGPQVGVNVDRLPTGEKLTSMFPWKMWQFTAADYQDGTPPLNFFQPNSNAQELMAVFDRFLTIADEVSGIPRYMQGETVGSAGRTSSGLAQLISNATKSMKQVVNNIDTDVLQPLLERQYQRNLRYSQDPDLIGDVSIQAKGAMSLVAKEAAAVRRAEFLQLALNSPVVQQIIGIPGTAELLRDAAKLLDLSVDNIVPSKEAIAQMMAQQEAERQMMMQAAMNPEFEDVSFRKDENGAITGATKRKPKQMLPGGTQQAGGREGSTARNVVTGRNG